MSIPTNPDLAAVDALRETLKSLTVEYPDGETEDFQFLQVDVGYVSTPTQFPYVSIHSGPSRGKPARLGRGDQPVAYDISVDCVVSIEYEDSDAERGYRRATQIRWAVWRHFIANRDQFRSRDISYMTQDEVSLNYLTDDGTFQDWGFVGVIYVPVTVTFRGA